MGNKIKKIIKCDMIGMTSNHKVGCLGKASAPGQINVDDLRAILNIR